MFGYSIEQFQKLNLGANNTDAAEAEGFKTSIKGFKTREEAQEEVMQSCDYQVVDSKVYEYEN